jgi:hypothetical protein
MEQMRKSKKRIVDVREDEVTVIQIEVDRHFIDFYKKETGRSRVSSKGLSQFIQNLVEIHKR